MNRRGLFKLAAGAAVTSVLPVKAAAAKVRYYDISSAYAGPHVLGHYRHGRYGIIAKLQMNTLYGKMASSHR